MLWQQAQRPRGDERRTELGQHRAQIENLLFNWDEQIGEKGRRADRCGIVSRSEIPPVGGVFRNCGEPSSLESVGQNRSHLGHGRHGACFIHTQEKNCSSYDEGRSSQNWKSPNLGPSQSPREGAYTLAPRKGGVACIFRSFRAS